jgi:membrane protein YdbS with pleckstrin-like domain
MDAELVRQGARALTRHSRRHTAVSALGPVTALAGLIWALAQPYRITLLDPDKHGFWHLAVQPPLLVILVGVVFHLWVVPGLLSDLEEVEEHSS